MPVLRGHSSRGHDWTGNREWTSTPLCGPMRRRSRRLGGLHRVLQSGPYKSTDHTLVHACPVNACCFDSSERDFRVRSGGHREPVVNTPFWKLIRRLRSWMNFASRVSHPSSVWRRRVALPPAFPPAFSLPVLSKRTSSCWPSAPLITFPLSLQTSPVNLGSAGSRGRSPRLAAADLAAFDWQEAAHGIPVYQSDKRFRCRM